MTEMLHVTSEPLDLVSLPPLLLGFQPVESVALLGIVGNRVAFCGRTDLNMAVEAAPQVLDAMRNNDVPGLALVAYSDQPEAAASVLHQLAVGIFDGAVAVALATNGETVWRVAGGALTDGEPFTPTLEQPSRSRAESVADVTCRRTSAAPGSTDHVAALPTGQRRLLLDTMLSQTAPLTPDRAAQLGAALDASEPLASVLDAVGSDAQAAFDRLVEARRWCEDAHLEAVLANLVVAAWASCHGAAANEALTQLEALPATARLVDDLARLTRTNPAALTGTKEN